MNKDTLSEVHVIARRVLFQLAGWPPRGTGRLHGRHVVELLLRLVSTPDALLGASFAAGQPGQVPTEDADAEAPGARQPGAVQIGGGSGAEPPGAHQPSAIHSTEAEAPGAYQPGAVHGLGSAMAEGVGATETGDNRVLKSDVLFLGSDASSGVRLGALRALAWLAENVQDAVDVAALDVLLPLLRTELERTTFSSRWSRACGI